MDIRQFAYAGIDVYGILSETTGKTVEELKKMDISYEILSQALQEASKEGGKYYKGQENAVDTLNGKINILKKTFQELLGEIAESLMPAIKGLTDKVQGVVNWFKSLNKSTKETIAKVGALVTLLSPTLVILGKIIKSGGSVFGVLSKATSGLGKLVISAGGFKSLLASLVSPIGIIITSIGVLAGAFIHLYTTNDTFREKANQTFSSILSWLQNNIMPVISQIAELVKNVATTIWEILENLWEAIEPLVKLMLDVVMQLWDSFGKIFVEKVLEVVTWLLDKANWIMEHIINPIVTAVTGFLAPMITTALDGIVTVVQDVFSSISSIWEDVKGVFQGIIDFITGVFTGDWETAWNGVKDVFSNIISGIGEIFKLPLNVIIDGINTFIDGVNKISIPDEVPVVGGIGFDIPKIPKLAKGGIIDESTLAMIGEGNSPEAVIPLDRTLTRYLAEAMKKIGRGEIIVNFYPQQMTEAEMEKAFNYVDRRYGMAY